MTNKYHQTNIGEVFTECQAMFPDSKPTFFELMFNNMVKFTEPVSLEIDDVPDNILIFDTTGIELCVTENNPKTFNALIRRLKSYYKYNTSGRPIQNGLWAYSFADCFLPRRQTEYINGYFCYADKFAILNNVLGIIRHIYFLDGNFKKIHPGISDLKKFDSPNDDKSVGDSKALKPVLSDFFTLHPNFHPDTFLGDSAFDTIETYGFLKDEFHFPKALIPF